MTLRWADIVDGRASVAGGRQLTGDESAIRVEAETQQAAQQAALISRIL